MTVGDRIKNRRLSLGMTQDELAQKTDYKSRSSINKIESSRNLPLWKVEQMAKALDCTPGSLMGWDEQESNITDDMVEEHIELISLYEQLNEKQKENVINLMKVFLGMYDKED